MRGQADGSALIHQGLTQVLVSVFGPREGKQRSQAIHNRASINVDVSIASFSSGEWRKRSKADKLVSLLTLSILSISYLILTMQIIS